MNITSKPQYVTRFALSRTFVFDSKDPHRGELLAKLAEPLVAELTHGQLAQATQDLVATLLATDTHRGKLTEQLRLQVIRQTGKPLPQSRYITAELVDAVAALGKPSLQMVCTNLYDYLYEEYVRIKHLSQTGIYLVGQTLRLEDPDHKQLQRLVADVLALNMLLGNTACQPHFFLLTGKAIDATALSDRFTQAINQACGLSITPSGTLRKQSVVALTSAEPAQLTALYSALNTYLATLPQL